VDRAIAARVSMIKLIQRSWTAEIGDSENIMKPKKMVRMIDKLTVI